MSEEDAFLRAIFDQPDDDTARLAFADWLDERGQEFDASWAELIRTQVPLARGPGDARERLLLRERELTPVVVAGWSSRVGLPPDVTAENWTRGFPLTLSGTGHAVCVARPILAGRVPLRDLNLKDSSDVDVLELVTWPELRLVRKLAVWADLGRVTPRSILALAGCEHLANLERLRMQWVSLNEAAVVAFLDSPHMAQIIDLRMVAGMGTLSERTRQRICERFGDWGIR